MWKSFMEWGPHWTEDDDKKWEKQTAHHQANLDSETINPNYPYAKQAETVRQCLAEAFGEYASDIRLVNRFFLELESFMRWMKKLNDYVGLKEGDRYEEVMDVAISGGNAIIFNLIDYGKPAIKKLKADSAKEWKTEDEITKLTKIKFDRFLSLLRERIQYEEQ